jgi:hypothetical protein
MTPKNKQPFTRLWTPEEHALIRQYYGAIRTTELIEILGRGSIKGINQKFAYYGWTPNAPVYGVIEIEYQGKIHKARGFTYKKEGNTVKNKVVVRCRVNKPRVLKAKPKEAIKKEKKEISHFKQVKEIKPFQIPEGKTLTKVDNKTWKYI